MKNKLILQILKKDLATAVKLLKQYEKDYKKALKLPNDPSIGMDIYGDGILNENPTLKLDTLTGLNHTIGYMNCLKFETEKIIAYLEMSEEEIKESLKKDKEIEKENRKYLSDIFKKIKKQ